MSFSERFINTARKALPMPFTIAVLLTFLTIFLALTFTGPDDSSSSPHLLQILLFWENGMWDGKLMVFAMQMMLILVLGHVLALSKPIDNLIKSMLKYCETTAKAAAVVTLFTLLVAFFNWGLGLIFGAIFARKVGEYAHANGRPINYAFIGAAGYSGLMVWHGGLSGSAPLKIAEKGHFFQEQIGQISLSETVFSEMNIFISLVLLILLPFAMYILGSKVKSEPILLKPVLKVEDKPTQQGMEKLDHSRFFSICFGCMIIFVSEYLAFKSNNTGGKTLSFINPNYINLTLFGMGLLLHANFSKFIQAIEEAIKGASGILIQFPLYFGIMGIMVSSGLVSVFSGLFVSISNEVTFPLYTFFSAGIVNIFVPSGGGQWAVQGPIIIEAAQKIGVSIPKCVMALAYGDQLTNMIQPFWALPLLGITGLKAKDLLPYTFFLMILGGIVFSIGLLLYN